MKLSFALASLLVLAGCAGFDGRGLVPGQSTAAEVEALMGPAAERRTRPDGETWVYYPRQPHGFATYVARIGADGRLIALEQRLTDENLARIEPGKTRREEVQELFGPPAETMAFPRMQRDVWEYRLRHGLQPYALYVQFSPDGIARELYMKADPDFQPVDSVDPPF
jgi:hypothetical protein